MALYKAANKDRIAKKMKEWHAKNAEHNRRYQQERRSAAREWRRNYNTINREAVLEGKRRYYKANKGAYLGYSRNRRARIARVGGSHTFDEVWQMYEDQDGLCAFCETPLFGSFEVDHLTPVSQGGRNDWTNLAVVCRHCNRTKCAKPAVEFWEYRQLK